MERIINSFPGIGMNIYMSESAQQRQLSDFHIHPEIELMYVTKGMIRWRFSEKEVEVQQGQGLFVNRLVPHATFAEKDSCHMLVQFSRNKLYDSQALGNDSIHRFIAGEEADFCLLNGEEPFHQELLAEIRRVQREYEGNREYREIFLHAASITILGLLLRNHVLSAGMPDEEGAARLEKILPVARYIEAHYNTPLSLSALADFAGFTHVYLCRLFKKTTGHTLTEYINYVRVEKSLEKLADHSLSITEVAFQSGFSSLSHFNTTFRAQIGCSPSVYRKARIQIL